jgi:hypothetical protein
MTVVALSHQEEEKGWTSMVYWINMHEQTFKTTGKARSMKLICFINLVFFKTKLLS